MTMAMKKDWLQSYRPADRSLWQGRTDSLPGERFFQRVQCIDLQQEHALEQLQQHVYALIGFCTDEGVRRNYGRVGAVEGPKALRQALAKLPYHDLASSYFYDVGDIYCQDHDLESAQQQLGLLISQLLQQNIKPIVLGGGHEIAWGHYQGIARARSVEKLGIINFDAHFDLRPLLADGKGSSGTPFLQIASDRQQRGLNFDYCCIGIQATANTQSLFDKAKELAVTIISAEEIHSSQSITSNTILKDFIQRQDAIYVTVCLDVFAACYAPGVSAPQLLGLTPWQVLPLLNAIIQSNKVISFDIAEMAPCLDQNNMTAQLGAVLLAHYLNTSLFHV